MAGGGGIGEDGAGVGFEDVAVMVEADEFDVLKLGGGESGADVVADKVALLLGGSRCRTPSVVMLK